MAKKNETEVVEVETVTTTTTNTDSLESALSEYKDKIKSLENEKVEILSKLTELEDAKVTIAQLTEEKTTLTNKLSETEKSVQNLLESVQKVKDENTQIKLQLKAQAEAASVTYNNEGLEVPTYKYRRGDFVRIPTRYQNLRFQVQELLGEGSKGPLYRIYCPDNDISISHVAQSELHPATNIFRAE